MNTEILLPVPELKQALGGLNKLIKKNSSLPVLNCVRVSRKSNGLVTIQGTDLDGYATFTLNNTQQGEQVDVVLPLEQLVKAYRSSLPKDCVALVQEGESTKLRYNIGGSTVIQPLNTMAIAEWPSKPTITAPSTPLPSSFGEALKQAMSCCSDESSRPILNGACLDARDAKAHYIVGTNGRVLFAANSFTFPMKEAVVVPYSKFIVGSGLLDSNDCSLTIEPPKKDAVIQHIVIENRQWQLVVRQIDGQFPNWKQVLPTIDSTWTTVELQESALDQLLKVIPNLPGSDNENNTVKLRVGHNCLWVEGKNRDDQDYTKVAISDVTVKGKAKEIFVNRDYLLPALKFGLSEMAILDELSPMVMSKAGKRMVIMPVRPNGPAPTETKTAPEPAQPSEVPASEPATTATPIAQDQPQPKAKEIPMPQESESKPTELSLLDQIDKLKETAKTVVRELSGLSDVVRQLEREKRSNEKEVETARAIIKKLQQVTI